MSTRQYENICTIDENATRWSAVLSLLISCLHNAHQEPNEQGAQDGHEIVSRIRCVQQVDPFLKHQCEPNQREGTDNLGNLAIMAGKKWVTESLVESLRRLDPSKWRNCGLQHKTPEEASSIVPRGIVAKHLAVVSLDTKSSGGRTRVGKRSRSTLGSSDDGISRSDSEFCALPRFHGVAKTKTQQTHASPSQHFTIAETKQVIESLWQHRGLNNLRHE